jgi:hypothetical protein
LGARDIREADHRREREGDPAHAAIIQTPDAAVKGAVRARGVQRTALSGMVPPLHAYAASGACYCAGV